MRIILKTKLTDFDIIKDLKKSMLVSTIALIRFYLIALFSKILTVIPGIPYKTGFKNIAEN